MAGITCAMSDTLELAIPEASAPDWHGLLRRGVGVFLEQAVSVRDFMTEVLGMDPHYATNSVPGLFLKGASAGETRSA